MRLVDEGKRVHVLTFARDMLLVRRIDRDLKMVRNAFGDL